MKILHKILALYLEHPKQDQNPKFTPLSETTSIPVSFIWEYPPPGFMATLLSNLEPVIEVFARLGSKRHEEGHPF